MMTQIRLQEAEGMTFTTMINDYHCSLIVFDNHFFVALDIEIDHDGDAIMTERRQADIEYLLLNFNRDTLIYHRVIDMSDLDKLEKIKKLKNRLVEIKAFLEMAKISSDAFGIDVAGEVAAVKAERDIIISELKQCRA